MMTFKFVDLAPIKQVFNVFIGASILAYLNNQTTAQAQIIEDNTLSTEVNTENNRDFTVEAGLQQGSNLFHSFKEFSIPNNGSVVFNNAATIQNIISRVTGSSVSDLNGLIGSSGTANLFLINPNGIVFGENARLNVGGSFIATTAKSLVFEDGSQFSTDLSNPEPLLTVNVPLGLQFGKNPGSITNQANFSAPYPVDPTGQGQIKLGLMTTPRTTLALLGGDVIFAGGAIAVPSGNIELGSVGANSFIALNPITEGWTINYANVSQFRDLVFDNLASVNGGGETGSSINVQGKRIQIFNGSAIFSDTLGTIDGGDVKLNASELIELNGSDRTNQNLDPGFTALGIFVPDSSRVTTTTFGSGTGGNIKLNTAQLSILDGAEIQAQTIAMNDNLRQQLGQSGNILLKAESIDLRGLRPVIEVNDRVQDLFPTPPEVGNLVDTERFIGIARGSSVDVVSNGGGNSGDISITTNWLKLEDNGTISNSPNITSGNGGDINIIASESVEISGSTEQNSSFVSLVTANTFGPGNSGNIDLTTKKLLLNNGGGITAGTLGMGNAGNIILKTQAIDIAGTSGNGILRSSIGSETFSIGDAGNLTIKTESLNIIDQGQITVRGLNTGSPGNLEIEANSIKLNNATITAENTFAPEGGNLELAIQNNLTLQENSTISARASNEANGGNVEIDTRFIIALPEENNDILANAVTGRGGNINIDAQGIFGLGERSSQPPNLTNDIDASSEFGEQGLVRLFFPQFTAFEGVFNLPSDFVDVNYLFRNQFCNISRDSSYIFTGRGGVPFTPEDDLPPQYTWSDWRILESEVESLTSAPETNKIEEVKQIEMIQGWRLDQQGRVVLTANSNMVTPHKPGLNSPDCNQARMEK